MRRRIHPSADPCTGEAARSCASSSAVSVPGPGKANACRAVQAIPEYPRTPCMAARRPVPGPRARRPRGNPGLFAGEGDVRPSLEKPWTKRGGALTEGGGALTEGGPGEPDADRGPRTASAPAAGGRTPCPARGARGGARTQPRRTDGMIDDEGTHRLVASGGLGAGGRTPAPRSESRSSTTAAPPAAGTDAPQGAALESAPERAVAARRFWWRGWRGSPRFPSWKPRPAALPSVRDRGGHRSADLHGPLSAGRLARQTVQPERAFVPDRADPAASSEATRREIDMRRGRHNRLGSSSSAVTVYFRTDLVGNLCEGGVGFRAWTARAVG